MSDDNDSGGIIGSIISILILIAIWPYLLAIIGLYIAYLAVQAALQWIYENPLIVVLVFLGVFSLCLIVRYRLIPKTWAYLIIILKPKVFKTPSSSESVKADIPNLSSRRFIPSTNLYCYWCTKKLGINAWEKEGKYFCSQCKERMMLATDSINT